MGYASTALRTGNIAVGGQFIGVGAEGGIDLTDVTPTGYDPETYVGGSISAQFLTSKGKTAAVYFWYDDEEGTGWFDGADELVEKGDVVFDAGEGLWVKANSASEGLQTSGQVIKGSVDIHLRAGNMLVCNPTPVAVNWNDDDEDGKFVSVSGYDAESYEGGSISAQVLTAKGKTDAVYFWYDDEEGTGWFDGADEFVEGVKLSGGSAVWVKANNTDEKITFPACL